MSVIMTLKGSVYNKEQLDRLSLTAKEGDTYTYNAETYVFIEGKFELYCSFVPAYYKEPLYAFNLITAEHAADDYVRTKNRIMYTKEELREAFIEGVKWLDKYGNESSNQ